MLESRPLCGAPAHSRPMQLALAPMEGLVDDVLRDVLTRVGGIDWCVTEFIRVTDHLLPPQSFTRPAPELLAGARTPAGTPLHVQLLGSDPACLADNAALACTLGAPVIDLNFGCPAKTVNRSRGGAILLREPELLHRILRAVRAAVPVAVPVTAKMRLGYEDTSLALDCARALADGGAARLVVHARTRLDGYRPPAHWEWIARVRETVAVPVLANGEIWSVDDWRRCRSISGASDFMLGRGLVARPDLALQIRAAANGTEYQPLRWDQLLPLVRLYWTQVLAKVHPRHAPGRLKQWLAALAGSYPQAGVLFAQVRRERDAGAIDQNIASSNCISAWLPARACAISAADSG